MIYRYDKTKIVTFKGTWVEIIINVGVVLFNLIKSIIVYLITLLVYKKLSTIIHHHTGDKKREVIFEDGAVLFFKKLGNWKIMY